MNYRLRISLFLVFTLCSVFMHASHSHHKKSSFLEKINTKWQKFKIDWWSTNYGIYGCKSVSPKNEQLVRDILQELQVPEREAIQVKKLSEYAINYKSVGSASIVVLPAKCDFPTTIFISEDWFDSFSLEEKRFLIGHEIAHLELNHSSHENSLLIKKYGVYGAFGLALLAVSKRYPGLRVPIFLFFLAGVVGIETIMMPGFMGPLIKKNELQADYYAAQTLHCVDGGISWLKKMKKYHIDLQEELPKTVCIACNYHPSFDERIELLEKLKEEMDFDQTIINQTLIR